MLNVPVSRAEYVVGIRTYFPAGRSLKLIDMVPAFKFSLECWWLSDSFFLVTSDASDTLVILKLLRTFRSVR